jgi:hypothetical protein
MSRSGIIAVPSPSGVEAGMMRAMPRKPTPPCDDPAESQRFIDMAREVGAEEPSSNFERVFRKVAERPKGFPSKASDGSEPASSRRSSRKDRP